MKNHFLQFETNFMSTFYVTEMKNPLNNSGKIFRWYIWVPYSAAFVCTNTEQQYHQCETNTIDTWTQIQSISRYTDHGVRGTIGLSIFLGDQEPQPPAKSGHSSICEQHRRRPACASAAQSDQRLFYSLFKKCHM